MTRRLATIAALGALTVPAAAGGQSANTNTYALLSPSQPVPAPPPLGAGANAPQTQTAAELQIPTPGKLSQRELVVVGVGPDGTPVRVVATQRILLTGTGDYAFTIPAPATSAGPGPGSQSSPGLRDVGIVWQGFSNKRRILSAEATLRTAEAAKALPLRVTVDDTSIRLANLTHRTLPVVTSKTDFASLLTVLNRLRKGSRKTQITGGSVYVKGTAGHGDSIDTAAPLHVTGSITQGTSTQDVDVILGRGRPLEQSIALTGHGTPKLALRVSLLPPIEILPTPAELRAVAEPLDALQKAIGSVAISNGYRRFLAAPTQAAPSDASYFYRSAAQIQPVAKATVGDAGESSTLVIILALLGGLAAVAGLAVVWARS